MPSTVTSKYSFGFSIFFADGYAIYIYIHINSNTIFHISLTPVESIG